MSASGAPLVVALMSPHLVEKEHLVALGGQRPVEVREAPYVDSNEARRVKAELGTEDEVRSLEAPVLDEHRVALCDAEVVVALDLPSDVGSIAQRLSWVQGTGAGVGQLARVLAPTPAVLTSAAGVAAPSMAEFIIARLLQVWKFLPTIDHNQTERRWERHPGMTAAGRRLGIIGLGAIGRELARRAAALDMSVIGLRRHPAGEPPAGVDAVFGPDGLHELLAASDAVVIAAAATPETFNLIGARELAAMRPGAILCNVARGSLVDEDALVAGLATGRPGAAILDVTRIEPLPETSPLWTTPGVYLSPHCSASVEGYAEGVGKLFIDNLARYLAGTPLRNVVDKVLGY